MIKLYCFTSELVLQVLKVRGLASEILSPSVLRLNLCSPSWRFWLSRNGFIRRLLALEYWYYGSHGDVVCDE
jgi:hypothetical protein